MNGKKIFKACLKVIGGGIVVTNIMGCGAVARTFVEQNPNWNPTRPLGKYLKFIGSYDYDALSNWIEAKKKEKGS